MSKCIEWKNKCKLIYVNKTKSKSYDQILRNCKIIKTIIHLL